ncbi:hypothetical protein GIB67_031415 [Kingdonia uniflora]|uniref:DUF632 domain-containing protein n=1 Tax=Kingdonia uniflora TaxID=39325 RepID=A0A7J7MB25_9MAGN|nr:hypothetical protein GIB67_031415 [Kingdonia uniflora]
MALALTTISSVGSVASPSSTIIDKKLVNTSLSSFGSISSISYTGRRQNAASQRRCSLKVRATKELHFNNDGSATKKFQIGVNKLTNLVGVTLEPKGRNVVLESKYGSHKIVNNGITVSKEVELEDPVENIGAKLVRQAVANNNNLAGDGTTTSIILVQGLIIEDVKVVTAGANPVQITQSIEKTTKALVAELKLMSKDMSDVAAVRAGNNYEVGQMIAEAMSKVGRKGVVTLEEGKSSKNILYVTEGIQFNWLIMMWKVMIECHHNQCQAIVEAKNLDVIASRGKLSDAHLEVAEQGYEKEKLNEKLPNSLVVLRSFKLENKLKEKKLRVKDVLNAIKAAVVEGIVVGGDSTILRLAAKVDAIKLTIDNDEQKVLHGGRRYCQEGFELSTEVDYKKCSDNVSVVMGKVLSSDNFKYGYNAIIGKYEDLMVVGIIDPTKVSYILKLLVLSTAALVVMLLFVLDMHLYYLLSY